MEKGTNATFVTKEGIKETASPEDADYPHHCLQTSKLGYKWSMDFTKIQDRGNGKPGLRYFGGCLPPYS